MSLTYQRKYIACGKASCRKKPDRHGPYWYAFWFAAGKTHCQYIGKHLPVDLDEGSKIVPEVAGEDVSSITVRTRAKKGEQPPPRPVFIEGLSVFEAHRIFNFEMGAILTRESARKRWYNRTHTKDLSPADLDRFNEAWVTLRKYYHWE